MSKRTLVVAVIVIVLLLAVVFFLDQRPVTYPKHITIVDKGWTCVVHYDAGFFHGGIKTVRSVGSINNPVDCPAIPKGYSVKATNRYFWYDYIDTGKAYTSAFFTDRTLVESIPIGTFSCRNNWQDYEWDKACIPSK